MKILDGNRLTQEEVKKLEEAFGLLAHLEGLPGQDGEFARTIRQLIGDVINTSSPKIETDWGVITRTPKNFIDDEWD